MWFTTKALLIERHPEAQWIYGTKYSITDYLSRSYHSNFFKGCLPSGSVGPVLNMSFYDFQFCKIYEIHGKTPAMKCYTVKVAGSSKWCKFWKFFKNTCFTEQRKREQKPVGYLSHYNLPVFSHIFTRLLNLP